MRTAIVEFGEFVLDLGERTLRRDGVKVALRPKAYGLLVELVSRPGALRTKEELLEAVWPDVAVSEAVLKVCVRELREVLSDDAARPRFIETQHRVGYRFIASARTGRAAHARGDARLHRRGIFVGRGAELARLDGVLDRAASGGPGPRVVLISGEPGLGKTALVGALIDRATARLPDILWCVGACVEQHHLGEPLLPFLQALASLASADDRVQKVLRQVAPTWCLHLPEVFPRDDGLVAETLGATRPRLVRELLAALRQLSSGHTLLWVLEDIQWADISSIDLLRHLALSSGDQRVVIVASARPSQLESSGQLRRCMLDLAEHGRSETLLLRPLNPPEVRDYLRISLGGELDRASADLVLARTEGHPLFLASLVESLIATRRGPDSELRPLAFSAAELNNFVPSSVDAMVANKLGRLDPDSRRMLAFASVLGAEFASDIIADMLRRPVVEIEECLDICVRVHRLLEIPVDSAGATTASLQYRFVHALYQNALYEELVPSRRAELHLAAATALRARADGHDPTAGAGRLAHHYARAGDPVRTLEQLWIASVGAERRLALADAEELCHRALDIIAGLPPPGRARDEARFRGRRAALRIGTGRFDDASEDLEHMRASARLAGDVDLEIEALMQMFRRLGYLSRFEEADARATEALQVAQAAGRTAVAAEIRGTVSSLRGVRGELEPACTMLSAVLAELALTEDGPRPVALLLDLGSYWAMRGCYAEATPILDELLVLARDQGDAMRLGAGLFWRALCAANLGAFDRALLAIDEAVGLAERNDDAFILPRLLTLRAWLHRELGDFEGAETWTTRASKVPGVARMPDGLAHVLLGAAAIRVGQGRDASEPVQQADEITKARFFGDWLILVRLAAVRARACLARGELVRARESAEHAIVLARSHDLRKRVAHAELVLAEIELTAGNFSAAVERLDRLDQDGVDRAFPLLGWRFHALRGRAGSAIGDLRLVETARRRAVALVELLLERTPVELGRSLVELARAQGLSVS